MVTETKPAAEHEAHGHSLLHHHFDDLTQQRECNSLAMWSFLATEAMMFGGLFFAYSLYRWLYPTAYHVGSHHLNITLGTINTFVLIASSVFVVMAWANLRLRKPQVARMWIALTLLCGFVFMGIKFYEYSLSFEHHHFPKTSNFFAIYFTMTGLHGLHVLGGMVVFTYFLIWGWKMYDHEPRRFTNRIVIVGLYWHFVDLVWIFLFPTLYLL